MKMDRAAFDKGVAAEAHVESTDTYKKVKETQLRKISFHFTNI